MVVVVDVILRIAALVVEFASRGWCHPISRC